MSPRVSVVMAVHNGEKYLEEAIKSILNQTFIDFEFIVVDDSSTDSSRAILTRYSDPRIRLVQNQENIGLTRSLNKGLRLAQGIFIARMDADDISLPERFERQVAFFSAHHEIGLLGVAYWKMNASGEKQQELIIPSIVDSMIRWNMLFGPVLAHPGVMFRKALIEEVGLYNESTRIAQDYELWTRMARVTKMSNLPEPLLLYREGDPSRISERHLREQWDHSCAISQQCLQELLENDIITKERVHKICALISLDCTCAEWDLRAAQDLSMVLERFFIRYGSNLTRDDRKQIADQICLIAGYHFHLGLSIEEWQINRQLIATIIRLRLPLPKGLHIWREVVKFIIGRKCTEYIFLIRSKQQNYK